MSVVSSKIIDDSAQADGRRWVTELHVDDAGVEHRFTYLCEKSDDVQKFLTDRAAQIDFELANPLEKPIVEKFFTLIEIEGVYRSKHVELDDKAVKAFMDLLEASKVDAATALAEIM